MLRAIVASVLCLALVSGVSAWPSWQAAAQADVQLVVERPRANEVASTTLEIAGYAYDPSAPEGTGIDAVHVYLDGEPGERMARFLGEASYGLRRPDVAQRVGDARFTNVGFSLLVEVPAGNHSLFVYAHRSGAAPNDGWVRASVPLFEASLIVPRPTMVQPGPPAVGSEDGRYRTGNVSWQGGRTCVRYNGRGECEQSVPFSIVTGATCIQWNQRGQCTAYLPEPGLTAEGPVPAPTRAAPAQPDLLRVPTVSPASRQTIPASSPAASSAPSGIRAVAPPLDPSSEGGQSPAGDAPPSGIRAVAPPPPTPESAAEGTPAFSSGGTARAAPAPPAASSEVAPPPTAASGGDPMPLPGTTPAGSPAGGASGGHSMAAMDELGVDAFAPPAGFVPADNAAPLATPVPPHVQATQTALGAGSAGVAPLRSGCALYLGCGEPQTTTSPPRATPTPTRTP